MTNAVSIAQGGSNNVTFRNKIINGAMMIDQRNAGASVTISGGQFPVDRFVGYNATDGVITAQQSSTVPAGFTKSVVLTATTADASIATGQYAVFSQVIEGYNAADLNWGTGNAKTVTLSFWAQSSLTGTFGGAIANAANNRSYPFLYTISVANTWTQISVTIPGDTTGSWGTTNDIGIKIYWGLGVGATYSGTAGAWAGTNYLSATGGVPLVSTLNATLYLTGVQLEAGSTATPFEYRQYGTELALCQRYCPAWTFSGSYTSVAGGFSPGTTGVYTILPYPVTPRVFATGITATGTYVGITAGYGVGGVGTLAISPYGNSENIGLQLTGSSGLTTGAGSFIACVATGTLIATGCEL